MNLANNIQPFRRFLAVAVLVALVATTFVSIQSAQAATSPHLRQLIRQVKVSTRQPMKVSHFDVAVAEAHGYHIITVNGVQESVKTDTGGSSAIKPYNVLYGNCGDSYFFISGTNGGYPYAYYFDTGFDVNLAAIYYGWELTVFGPYDVNRPWSNGGPIFGNWDSGTIRTAVDDYGFYVGEVATTSFAILVDGSYCTSAGPNDSTYVTK